jgi:hypothetical protein
MEGAGRQPGLRSVAKHQDLGHRQRLGMCDGEQRRAHLHSGGAPGRSAMQPELRRTAGPDDFDITPEDAARMPGAERLHRRFLGGESSGEVRNRVPAAHTISHLPVGENAAEEALPVPVEGRADARNVGRVESKSENVHDLAPA